MSSFEEFIEGIKSQDYEVIQKGLKNEDISVSSHDKSGKCALEYAMDADDVKLLALLVESGRFDLTQVGCDYSNGPTVPLLYAPYEGKIETTKYMINAQKDCPIVALYFAAANGGNLDMIKWFINSELVDLNSRNETGSNVLQFAAKYPQVFDYLIDNKIVDDTKIMGCECNLAHLGAGYGNSSLIQRFLNAGGDINALNEKGEVPLHRALKHGNVEVVKFLIEHGAFVDITSENGDNTIDMALRADNEDLLRALDLEKNREGIEKNTFEMIAGVFDMRGWEISQERYLKYLAPILPDSMIEKVLGHWIFPSLMVTGRHDLLEEPFKLAYDKCLQKEVFLDLVIDYVSRGESLDVLKEVFRLLKKYAPHKLATPKTLLSIFTKCLNRVKVDFIKYLVEDKYFDLDLLTFSENLESRFYEVFLELGYQFEPKHDEAIASLKKELQDLEISEAAKGFNAEEFDAQLNGLEGAELDRRVRVLLVDVIEKGLLFGVRHILEKWKPSTKAVDYHSYPLNLAVKHRNRHMVDALCEYGFSVNVYDGDGTDAFVLALKAQDSNLAGFIVKRGLWLNMVLPSEDAYPILLVAKKYRDENLAITMYRSGACLPDFLISENGWSLMHIAALANWPLFAYLLHSENNNFHFSRDAFGNLPCHLAFLNGSLEFVIPFVPMLKSIAILSENGNGYCPLELAIECEEYLFLIKLLHFWPELGLYIDIWENGIFKDLRGKYQPSFCSCGVGETPQWAQLKLATCEYCAQKLNDDDLVLMFMCGSSVHSKCLDPKKLKCAHCGIRPISLKENFPDLKRQCAINSETRGSSNSGVQKLE